MLKILLVEDDNNLREIYEARLQAEGYVIASAKDGEEALVVAKSEKPDLIISDVMMPKISGFEMLDILRNTPGLQDSKVIMLTALGQAEDQSRASHLGADRYLVKSQVTLEDIVKVAHELLGDAPQENQATTEPVQTNPTALSPVLEDQMQPAPPAEPMQQQPLASAPVNAPQMEDQMQPAPPAEPMQQQPLASAPVNAPQMEDQNSLVNAALSSSDLPVEDNQNQTQAPVSDEISINSSGQLSTNEPAESTQSTPNTVQDSTQTTSQQFQSQSESTIPNPTMDATQVSNDQTLNSALDDLMSDKNQPPVQQTSALNADSDTTTPGVNDPSTESTSEPTLPNNAVSGRKIIQPLDQVPKKSLDELLAMEGASQQAMQSPVEEGSTFDPTDPNNIAL